MLRQEGVETFRAYCRSYPDLGALGFSKLCKECRLVDRGLTAGDVDLVFARCVPTAGSGRRRRMDLRRFEDALRLVAERKGLDVCEVCRLVEESGGPVSTGTRAGAVRFHDDRSTYTGTHVHGGPSTSSCGGGASSSSGSSAWFATLRAETEHRVERSLSDGGALPRHERLEAERTQDSRCSAASSRASGSFAGGGAVLPARRASAPERVASAPESLGTAQPEAIVATFLGWAGGTLEDTFKAYSGTQSTMDGKSFLKLCKDCNLVDKSLTAQEVDLIFTRVLPKGKRRLDARWFKHALWHVAERKGLCAEALYRAVAALGKPILHGTTADIVRFHDDKRTYTGTHAHGGPDVSPTGQASASDVWISLLRPDAGGSGGQNAGASPAGPAVEHRRPRGGSLGDAATMADLLGGGETGTSAPSSPYSSPVPTQRFPGGGGGGSAVPGSCASATVPGTAAAAAGPQPASFAWSDDGGGHASAAGGVASSAALSSAGPIAQAAAAHAAVHAAVQAAAAAGAHMPPAPVELSPQRARKAWGLFSPNHMSHRQVRRPFVRPEFRRSI